MKKKKIKEIVNNVLSGRMQNADDKTLIAYLVEEKIKKKSAFNILQTIETGFKKGTLSAVGKESPLKKQSLKKDLFFYYGFKRGKKIMRYTSSNWLFIRFILPWIAGLILLGYTLYYSISNI